MCGADAVLPSCGGGGVLAFVVLVPAGALMTARWELGGGLMRMSGLTSRSGESVWYALRCGSCGPRGVVGRGENCRAVLSFCPLAALGVFHGRPDGFCQGLLSGLGERGLGLVTPFVAADTVCAAPRILCF